MLFENRQEAGRRLAFRLTQHGFQDPILLALPRGGVPVGYEVAEILGIPIDVIVSRKISAPGSPEFGIGAIAEGDVLVLDEEVIKRLKISKEELNKIVQIEKEELKRRVTLYRNNKPLPILNKRIVILVDDGLATGVTSRAAIVAIKNQNPKLLIFASPVCALDTAFEFKKLVDDIICLTTPVDFSAVGYWYRIFEQVTDTEVVEFLRKSKKRERQSVGIVHT